MTFQRPDHHVVYFWMICRKVHLLPGLLPHHVLELCPRIDFPPYMWPDAINIVLVMELDTLVFREYGKCFGNALDSIKQTGSGQLGRSTLTYQRRLDLPLFGNIVGNNHNRRIVLPGYGNHGCAGIEH